MSRWKLLASVLLIAGLFALSGCDSYRCSEDGDCPLGYECVGLSLCALGGDCLADERLAHIWDGEFGVCAPIEERLCRVSGGEWDLDSCGHYSCGEFPDCDAVIPGCDCGPDANFVEALGCVPDRACQDGCEDDRDCPEDFACRRDADCPEDDRMMFPSRPCYQEATGACEPGPALLCEKSDGEWDELACGHYACGEPNLCEAIIPGCDCGPDQNFVEGEGCVPDRACHDDRCDFNEDCPDGYECVGSSVCPPDVVCVWEGEPGVCEPSEEALCHDSGGRWDESSCGHLPCGPGPHVMCLAIIPGCDCGEEARFVDGKGCVPDPACQPGCRDDVDCAEGELCELDPCRELHLDGASGLTRRICPEWLGETRDTGICRDEVAVLCERTSGFLDYPRCDLESSCELDPICSCGPGRGYVDGHGCLPRPASYVGCDSDEECSEDELCQPFGCYSYRLAISSWAVNTVCVDPFLGSTAGYCASRIHVLCAENGGAVGSFGCGSTEGCGSNVYCRCSGEGEYFDDKLGCVPKS